jgi:hypothetical protein
VELFIKNIPNAVSRNATFSTIQNQNRVLEGELIN